MDSFVTDTQPLVKFMMGKKVINDRSHQAFQSADEGEATIIIPAIVLMEVLYLFEKNRIDIGLLQTEDFFKSQNYIRRGTPMKICIYIRRGTPMKICIA